VVIIGARFCGSRATGSIAGLPDGFLAKDRATAQITTLRAQLVKLGVWLERSLRRVVMHFPAALLRRREWGRLAVALGAIP
jgi:hypothetical protein